MFVFELGRVVNDFSKDHKHTIESSAPVNNVRV